MAHTHDQTAYCHSTNTAYYSRNCNCYSTNLVLVRSSLIRFNSRVSEVCKGYHRCHEATVDYMSAGQVRQDLKGQFYYSFFLNILLTSSQYKFQKHCINDLQTVHRYQKVFVTVVIL